MKNTDLFPMRLFISYSTKDLSYANAVRQLAENVGHHAFLAEYSLGVGQQIDSRLVNEIRAADMLVLVWSKNAHASEWVRDEVGIALGAHKAVLPIALDTETPMPAFIRGIKYINASTDPVGTLPTIQRVISEFGQQFDHWKREQFSKQVEKENWDGLKTIAAVAGVIATVHVMSGGKLK